MVGAGECYNSVPFTSRAQPMTWATKLCPELAKGVIGVAKAFGSFILLLDQPSIPDLAHKFRPRRPTNVAADNQF